MKLDLRLLQILFLASVLIIGISYYDWDIHLPDFLILLLTALLTQSLFCLAFNIPIHALKSAIITSIGICIVLRSEHQFIYALAGFFAIGSKYILRHNHKHFINPANFGIVFIILFTGVASITKTPWEIELILFFVIWGVVIIQLTNPKKIDLVLSFVFFYFAMDFAWRYLNHTWSMESFLSTITNGSMVFFTFFMIMDPCSTPNSRPARIFWVMLVSLVSFYMTTFHALDGAPLYALFLLSPLVPILDHFAKEPIFAWDSIKKRELHSNALSQ